MRSSVIETCPRCGIEQLDAFIFACGFWHPMHVCPPRRCPIRAAPADSMLSIALDLLGNQCLRETNGNPICCLESVHWLRRVSKSGLQSHFFTDPSFSYNVTANQSMAWVDQLASVYLSAFNVTRIYAVAGPVDPEYSGHEVANAVEAL